MPKVPMTVAGKVVATLTALMGVCVVALLTGIVATGFTNQVSMRRNQLEAEIIETPGHPVVLGQWRGAGETAPTVLVYGHYDVQPPQGHTKTTPRTVAGKGNIVQASFPSAILAGCRTAAGEWYNIGGV